MNHLAIIINKPNQEHIFIAQQPQQRLHIKLNKYKTKQTPYIILQHFQI